MGIPKPACRSHLHRLLAPRVTLTRWLHSTRPSANTLAISCLCFSPPRAPYLAGSAQPLKRQCPPSVSAAQKPTTSEIADECRRASAAFRGRAAVPPKQRDCLGRAAPALLPRRLGAASPCPGPGRLRAQGPWHLSTVRVPTSSPVLVPAQHLS